MTGKRTHDPGLRAAAWIAAALVALGLSLALAVDSGPMAAQLAVHRLGVLASSVALIWCVWSLARTPKAGDCDERWRYALVGIGLGCAGMVNSMIGMYQLTLNQTSPQIDTVVQVSGLFTYLAWSVALFALPAKRILAERKLPWMLDVALIVVSLTAAGWFFLIAPQVSFNSTPFSVWLTFAYPLTNLISFASVVAAMTLGGPFRSSRGLLMLAIIGNVTGDVVQAITGLNHVSVPQRYFHVLWMASTLLAGLASLTASREIQREPFPLRSDASGTDYGVRRAVLPAVFVGTLFGLAIWGNWARPNTTDVFGLNLGCAIAVTLALGRLLILVKENSDLARSLKQINEDLDEQVRARTAELSQAKEDVEQQKAFLRSVIDAIPSFVVTQTNEGRIALANEAAGRTFGRTVEQLVGARTRVMGAAATGGDKEVVLPDGSRRIFEVVRTPVSSADGGPDQLLVVGNDITLRKEAERTLIAARDAAEQAFRVKRDFLTNMSHELRTPMNGVLGFAELLLTQDLPPRHRQWAGAIRHSGESLLAIINDILDLTELESGHVKIEAAPTTLASVMTECAQSFRPQAAAKLLDLRCEVHLDPIQQFATDAKRIRQILGHLLSNAVKFTQSGTIWLEVDPVRQQGETVVIRISVRDTGVGIPANRLESIFDSFTQADTSTTRKFGGAGLGLSLCRQFVTLMGGTISVESREGQGTRFMVDLPLKMVSEKPLAAGILSGLHALVVEDNPVNQMIMERLLERVGCTVSLADNGQEAVEWLASKQCDLVLMDCQMPVMDGFEATRQIRQMATPARDVPIVAVTANAMEGDRERCLAAGMNEYVSKPIMPETLLRVIARSAALKPAA